ncbi:non-ribosomal peptide synthetase, partial [Nocardiopsis halotolerans]|uniref:non-ribosomal peptide synthetase n=1 Tax=Nocardiopsis halotolerans TaxID=124252 RepID=UPI001360B19F
MAGRYPGAENPRELWDNLCRGTDSTAPYPEDRWWCRWDEDTRPTGGFVRDAACFDAEYFGLTGDEAAAMDPQERLFVETVHSAVQDSGHTTAGLNEQGRVGVFVGVMNSTYNGRTAHSSIANRTSHLFDFQGSSVAVDTACSSSLTAVHMALESLYSGDNDCVVAGGVNLLLDQDHFRVLEEHGLLSRSGRCRPFSEHADGFLAAEAVGAVVLRPLEDALASGDHVHAVIRGSAVNAGGRSGRYGTPSLRAQRDVVARALEKAGTPPSTISYVETHGTATQLGDSIEISALAQAFGEEGPRTGGNCSVGSVKSNLGHCESASGVVGLTKVLMQFRYGRIAPSINAEELNSGIVFRRTPFSVRRELVRWEPVDDRGRPVPRRAGVSCFGAGGSNAHLVVEEYTGTPGSEEERHGGPHLVPLSARTPEQLRESALLLADHLDRVAGTPHEAPLRDVAYTLQVGRDALPHRMLLTVSSTGQLASELRRFAASGEADARTEPDGEVRDPALRWLDGGSVDWQELWRTSRPRRTSLPTYPFTRTEHWYRSGEAAAVAPDPEPRTRGVQAPSHRGEAVPETRLRDWLRDVLAAELAADPRDLDTTESLPALGLSSRSLVRVAREIQSGPDPDFDAASLFEYDTVDLLADHLAERGAVVADRGERADAAGERRGAEPASHTLSQAQQGLWALQREAPGSSAYNVPLCFRATDLDVRALSEAFTAVRARHGVLSGVVRVERGAPVLRHSPGAEPALEERHLPPMTRDEVFGLVREHAKEPFDPEHGPLCRISVFHLSDGTAWVLVNAHHLVLDGVSAMVLLKELLAHYRALTGGGVPDAAAPEATYAEFVTAEESGMRGEEGTARLEYWRNRLSSPLPALALPTDRPRSLADRDARGATETWRLTEELGVRIDRFTHDHGVYASAVFLAAFKTLLHRHTQQDDVIVGTAVNTRPDRRFDGTVGHFVDMVPVRSRVRREAPFLELCREVQAALTSGVARAYPFTALVRELGLSTADGGSPVFGNAFMYQDWYEDVTGGTREFEYVEGIHQEGEYELVLEVVEPADDLTTYSVRWKYRPDLFDGETVRNLGRQYLRLLEEVLARPRLAVGEAPLISDEERRTLTVEWNDTAASHPSLHVHELVSEQAARVPEATALVFGGDSLTYRELDDRARRLAVYLETLGVRPGARVAVYMERSFDLVVALLATMRAGCAYVPLDPSHPRSRIAHILDDAAAGVVLSQADLRDRVAALTPGGTASGTPRVVLVDEDWSEIADTAGAHRDVTDRVTGNDPAYVIYTSGSTGAPKGVVVPHRALTNFLCSMARRPGLRPSDRVLAVTTHSFDIAALEIYLPLVTGALCHLCDGDTARDPDRLRRMIGAVRPSLMQATPSTWTMLLHAGWTNDERMTVLCGGEPMPETLKDRLVASGAEVWNMFGPTETTVWSTVERVEAHRGVTIGRPIDNTQVHILDERGELVPTGAPGELCIAGEGVALGYLNKPELTAERFRDNPFPPGGKLYRTGDLARWRGDGSIECLGRIDSQVKIRGFRVELGEIEHVLATHPAVAECVAQARGQSGTQQLVVHYAPVDGHGADTGELRRYLAGRLPDYMVPAFLVPVERMPRTPNGKVDREALAELGVIRHAGTPERTRRPEPAPEREDAAPEEGDVLALWREVLGADDLTPTDAFLDAGGSSVLAAVLAERVSERYGTPFTSAEVFTGVNARGMAERLRAERARVDGSGRDHEGSGDDTAGGLPGSSVDGVAIVGVSCRLPGAEDHQEFWARLLTGEESVEVLSRDELRRAGVDGRLAEDPAFVPVRASMRGKGDFDADFFRISARDAELMDPQSRLLLQHSWKAVEDAAYLPEDVADAAVYVSTSNMLYQAPLRTDGAARDSEALVGFLHAQPGTIPTTISHKLGLHGPSLFVHSNCSSSLAGLALAFQAIRSGQTTHALVGGAGMYGERPVGYVYEEGMTLSSDGHCGPFSDDATGMVGGEGVVVFLLKDARAAVRDGDHVYAVIRGVGMNNDGAEKAGYYAPGATGQTEVISSVLERTGVDPETIRYVEAHGTGTRIGDPIEVGALSAAFRRYTDARGFCGIGSVKSNLGHLDAAAGLAGCLKAALALGERRVPPTINHREPNPQIDFEGSPFYVVTELTELAPSSGPLRAGVSSFGIGGTNVHALLEEPPAPEGADDGEPSGPHLVPLSARGLPNLRRYARDLARRISGEDRSRGRALRIADVAHTLRVGRTPMAERVAFVVDGVDELVHALDDFADGGGGERCFRPGSADLPSPSNGDDQRDLARRWMAEERLDEVARLWVEGGHVDWRDLRVGAHRPRRVPLPTYPFSEEYHWLPERPARRVADAPGGDGRGSDEVELRYFEEYWSPEPAAGVAEARGVVVCFLTGEEERDAFRRSVPEHAGNARLVFVERAGRGDAETSATPSDGVYRVGSRDEAGLRRTLDAVAEEHGAVGAIHYLWPLEYGGDTVLRVLADLAPLVRALAASALEVTDLLVAGHFHDAVGQAALDAVIGYERSLGSVLPGTATRVVLHEGTATPERWAELLFTEQCQERRVSVMYRGERRYVCTTRRLEAGVRR